MKRLPVIGVMGSSQTSHEDLAAPLGRFLASLPVHLLTGGGQAAMTAVARAFTSVEPRAGLSIGVIPAADLHDPTTHREGYPNPYVELAINTHLIAKQPAAWDGLTRNHINILSSDAVIALPGSNGTRHEIKMAIDYQRPVATLFRSPDEMGELPKGVRQCADLGDIEDFLADHVACLATQSAR